MQRKHNKEIVPLAKMLRKNMTKEEKHLWYDFCVDIRFVFLVKRFWASISRTFTVPRLNLLLKLTVQGIIPMKGSNTIAKEQLFLRDTD